MHGVRKLIALVVVGSSTALLTPATPGWAGHWSAFGGDAGRSGSQLVDPVALPASFAHRTPALGEPRGSAVLSGGAQPSQQALAFLTHQVGPGAGDDTSTVHVRSLADGSARAAVDIQDSGEPDTFGPPPGPVATQPVSPGVSPVIASPEDQPGEIYVVHNDTDSEAAARNSCFDPVGSNNDIAIARLGAATGQLREDVAVGPAVGGLGCPALPQPSDGYTVESSPVITPVVDAATGKRILLFIARRDAGGDPRLFAVTITQADTAGAVIATESVQFRDIPAANTIASPSIAYLADPTTSAITPYVVVSVNAGAGATDIRTFKATDLSVAGPANAADVPGHPQTVSVPAGDGKAAALFAAYDNGNGTTTVRRFAQAGNSATLTESPGASPQPVNGIPATALALTAHVAGGTLQEGRVVLTTGMNLYLLDTQTLGVLDRLRDVPAETALLPGQTGFARNTAATSGGFVFVSADDGGQSVLGATDGEPVPSAQFSQDASNATSSLAAGQPAISHGFAVLRSDVGTFAYRTGIANTSPPSERPPADTAPPAETAPSDSMPPTGDPAVDRTSPETTIEKTAVNKRKRRVKLTFFSSEAESAFRCGLDAKPRMDCVSPMTYKRLKRGRHTVTVVAIDAAGNVDPAPATTRFRIPKRR